MPYARFRNTTSIDDLDKPNTDKFIRSYHDPPEESGMNKQRASYQDSYNEQHEQHEQHEQQHEQHIEHFTTCQCSMCMSKRHTIPSYNDTIVMCPSVFEHLTSCPVCKKLYGRDSDHTIYILIIIILVVACGLLFKRAFLN